MHVELTKKNDTEVLVTITAVEEDLSPIRQTVLKKLSKDVKVAGYREGKVPPQVAEKHLNTQTYQTEFLDEAMTVLYAQATHQEKIRPITQPNVNIKKFVPFSNLEFEVETTVLGEIKLGKYKGLSLSSHSKEVTSKDVENVLGTLQNRLAEKKEVNRAAKDGDETVLDFSGKDSKKNPIPGADGKDYPLVLGSKSFIPGFEDEVIGLKAGDKKSFNITFPKDYGAKNLAGVTVTFDIEIKKVNELVKPKIDDEMAKKVGPFEKLSDLKNDIKKQLEQEAGNESLRDQQNEAVDKIAEKSEVKLPEEIIQKQAEIETQEVKRTLAGRGMTFEEFLKAEGTTEGKYQKEVILPRAEQQLKIGILLTEIAEKEGITVSEQELDAQMEALRAQYSDPQMQAQLANPDARKDIANRILSQKVVNWVIDNKQ